MRRSLKRSSRAAALGAMLGCIAMLPAHAEDLLQIYRDARANDPSLAAAQANWQATQERVPQARSLLLPNVNVTAAANGNVFDASLHTNPRTDINGRGFFFGSATVSASQPLYRYANKVALEQARDQVEQSDFTLQSA